MLSWFAEFIIQKEVKNIGCLFIVYCSSWQIDKTPFLIISMKQDYKHRSLWHVLWKVWMNASSFTMFDVLSSGTEILFLFFNLLIFIFSSPYISFVQTIYVDRIIIIIIIYFKYFILNNIKIQANDIYIVA